MTSGTRELWWESPAGEWFWQASDGNWYPAAQHPSRSRVPDPEEPLADPWASARDAPDRPPGWEAAGAFALAQARESACLEAGPGRLPWIASILNRLLRRIGLGRLGARLASQRSTEAGETARRRVLFLVSLGGVLAVGLALRICYVVFAQPGVPLGSQAGDALNYHFEALAITHGLGFTNPKIYLQSLSVPHLITPDAEYAPLTAMVLSVLDLVGLSTYFMHQIVWCVIGTVTVAVIAFTAREIAGDAVGLVAGGVAALFADLWINDGMVESETLVQLGVALLIFLAFRFWKHPNRWLAAGLGATVGISAMSRTESLLFVPFLILPLALTARRQRGPRQSWKERLVYLTIAGSIVAAVIAPWSIRNTLVFDHPEYLATSGGETLAQANNNQTYYGSNLGGWNINVELKPAQRLGDASDQDAALRHQAILYVEHHLSRVPAVVTARLLRVWGLDPSATIGTDWLEGRQTWASVWGLVMLYMMIPTSLLTIAEFRWMRLPLVPLLAPVAVVTFTAAAFFGNERYRAVASPALVLLSTITAISWSDLPSFFRKLRRGLSPRSLLGIDRHGEEVAGLDSDVAHEAVSAEGLAMGSGARGAAGREDPGGIGGWSAAHSGWGGTSAATGVEILPARPERQPTFGDRRVGSACIAAIVAAIVFVGGLSYIDITGKSDFAPRSGKYEAELIANAQLNNKVNDIQLQNPYHFRIDKEDGTRKVTAGSPRMTYTVTTATQWVCAPQPQIETTVTVSWPGAKKPYSKSLAPLSPLYFVPQSPIACAFGHQITNPS